MFPFLNLYVALLNITKAIFQFFLIFFHLFLLYRLSSNLEMNVVHFKSYGKNFIKSQRMSPDSYIQMAMQYAFYK